MMSTEALFAYGTLICPGIMSAVSGISPEGELATLHGYCRYRMADEAYPGVIAGQGSVDGVLYRGVTVDAWGRLDAFEGDEYQRRTVRVTFLSGDELDAFCYVIKPEYEFRLTDQCWDYGRFMREERAGFLARFGGFDRL